MVSPAVEMSVILGTLQGLQAVAGPTALAHQPIETLSLAYTLHINLVRSRNGDIRWNQILSRPPYTDIMDYLMIE